MSKKRPLSSSVRQQPGSRASQSGGPKDDKGHEPTEHGLFSSAGIREVVESIVIAFVLAFLFRTFEAEAFVIPTGSMAPTLMGRHKDLVCDQCGFPFQASASDEVDQRSNRANGTEVIAATCPLCRHTMYLGPNHPLKKSYPSYKGDRILVGKFPYEFAEPKRWDVVVFKYPEEAKTNFIKRLVGLPGETIRITHGDVFVRRGSGPVSIARKPPQKILAMLQPVDDTRYLLPQVVKGTWPSRWSPVPTGAGDVAAGWRTDEPGSFRTDGTAQDDVWLHYRHFVPSYDDWRQYFEDPAAPVSMKPQLISDFSAYNTESTTAPLSPPGFPIEDRTDWLGQAYTSQTDKGLAVTGPPPAGPQLGLHWVGDLAVEARFKVESDHGELTLALVEGGWHFQCRIDLSTGKASLHIVGLDKFLPTASTKVRGPGTYRITFANVDDQLVLWVNGRVVSFAGPGIEPGGLGGAVAYRLPAPNWRPQPDDLEPVRIGAKGAKLRVDQLRVGRDLYYIAQKYQASDPIGLVLMDFDAWSNPYRYQTRQEVARVLSDPNEWDAFAKTRAVDFTLQADQFFMLGDNSAESKDSRLWANNEFFVKRELLIGKALVIYWPHSLDRIPGTPIPIRFFPNFWRMGLVR